MDGEEGALVALSSFLNLPGSPAAFPLKGKEIL
jgi:hypothetical protein